MPTNFPSPRPTCGHDRSTPDCRPARASGRGAAQALAVLTLGTTLLAGVADAAQVHVAYQLQGTDPASAATPTWDAVFHPTPISPSIGFIGASSGDLSAAGFGATTVTAGGLHAAANARATGSDWLGAGSGSSVMTIVYTDTFVVHVPGVADGTFATLTTAPIHVDAALGGSVLPVAATGGQYTAGWNVSASMVGYNMSGKPMDPSTWYHGEGVSAGGVEPPQSSVTGMPGHDGTLVLPIFLGQPVQLTMYMHLSADVYAAPGSSATSFSDLSHSFTWGGLAGLVDGRRRWLSGYTAISSETGFDYVNAAVPLSAVPEPAAASLWTLSLGLLAWRCRARRSRR